MSLAGRQDRDELRTLLREFLTDRCAEPVVRRAMETESGIDPELWAALGRELGVCGLAVPTGLGGTGHGIAEVAVVGEELGRVLACVPYLSSVVLGQTVLLTAGDPAAARRWLPRLASAESRAAVAVLESSGRWEPSGVRTAAIPDRDRWLLTGDKEFVVDGHSADVVFVLARTEVGLSFFEVDGRAEGMVRTALPTMDLTRKQARLELRATPARLVGGDGAGWDTVARLLPIASVVLAAESLGGMQRTLEMSVEYSKVRVQFGRPTGSFQAIKHKCADMLLAVESARSAVYHAAETAATDRAELPLAASLAAAYSQDAYLDCAAENIQVHGGIGFTWEHPAQLYYKRAQSNRVLLGDPVFHRALAAEVIGL
ncbi:MAG TPA: acyl-CoA dehydrogenase family protein [Pseudonocardia sp.]|jgi:alkylation response protein AidB-like acyl-CoA dehydrogenase